MVQHNWQERVLATPDLDIAWYEIGDGPVVLFLNGGPGDDHKYLRPVAEVLCQYFRCVLYDQRGCGRSLLGCLDETTLQVEHLLRDIEALRVCLNQERLNLVGHSWGANLALQYGIIYPRHVSNMALVGLGPLDEEMSAVASANLLKPLSREEREERARLSLQRKLALEEADMERVHATHARLMEFTARGWFYSPEKAEQFLADYLSMNAHKSHNRRVNEIVIRSYRRLAVWDKLNQATARVLVVYGCQDFEPIAQAYLLREKLPQTRIALLNECGHLPWLEQPELFYRELVDFFRGAFHGPVGPHLMNENVG